MRNLGVLENWDELKWNESNYWDQWNQWDFIKTTIKTTYIYIS